MNAGSPGIHLDNLINQIGRIDRIPLFLRSLPQGMPLQIALDLFDIDKDGDQDWQSP